MRGCGWDFLFIEAEEASQGIKASHTSQLMTIFRNKDSKANYLLKKSKYLFPRYTPPKVSGVGTKSEDCII